MGDLMRELSLHRPRRRVAAAALATAVAAPERAFTLVLDDVHVLDEPACIRLVTTVAEYVGPGSQLVLSSRPELPVPLADLRVHRAIVELGVDDLRLSADEAAALLHSTVSHELREDEVASLTEATEGWAVGLYLAAKAYVEQPDDGKRAFRGSHRHVADYIQETMLSERPADEVGFLLQTSVLEELSASLCDAALAIDRSGARLDALAASNLLVIPLDDQRERYRYHHLLREMLRARLEHVDPRGAAEVAQRASDWSERHGQVEQAVAYAMEAGDVDRVAELISRHGQRTYNAGGAVTTAGWLAWLSEHADLRRYPMVAVLGSWFHVLSGNAYEAERWLDLSEPSGEDPPLALEVEGARILASAALCRAGVERMKAEVDRAGSLIPASSPFRAMMLTLSGIARLGVGDVHRATERFERVLDVAPGIGASTAAAVALGELASVALERGEVDIAARHAAAARTTIEEEGLAGYDVATLVLAASARVRLAQGDPVLARRCIEEVLEIEPGLTHAFPTIALQTDVMLARAAIGLGELSLAERFLTHADEIVARRPALGTFADGYAAMRDELATMRASARQLQPLTPAEARLLPLLSTHRSFREIGEQLFISPHTVKTQAISIYRKLGVTSRSEAVDVAREIGLLAGD